MNTFHSTITFLFGTALFLLPLSGCSSSKEKTPSEKARSVVASLPDPSPSEMESTKREAYAKSGDHRRRGEILSDLPSSQAEDGATFAMMLLSEKASSGKESSVVGSDDPKEEAPSGQMDSSSAWLYSPEERVFGRAPEENDISKDTVLSSQGRTYVSAGEYSQSDEERLSYDIKRAAALMAALEGKGTPPEEDDNSGNSPVQSSDTGSSHSQSSVEESSDPWEGTVTTSGRIAPYEGGNSLISFPDGSFLRGRSFSDGSGVIYGEIPPIKCVFLSSEKIRSGERISLRTVGDVPFGETVLEDGSILSATVTIGERLFLEVHSIPLGGKNVLTHLTAFDSDGMKGLYCPETALSSGSGRLSREAVSRGGSVAGGALGGLAGSLLRSGASLLGEASSVKKVRVYPGYEFELRIVK